MGCDGTRRNYDQECNDSTGSGGCENQYIRLQIVRRHVDDLLDRIGFHRRLWWSWDLGVVQLSLRARVTTVEGY